jgi:protein-S-isoprenylcysteine O-methyltransferase Ste14
MQLAKISWVLCKTAIFTALVPYTVGWWLPMRIHRAYAPPADVLAATPWQLTLSQLLLFLGAAIYLWCAWDFSVKGLGTPAPIDAPKNLVVNGLYGYVRNPMYVGVACIVVSRALFFWSLPILVYLGFIVLCANLFVRFYEEPHLRAVFGEQYIAYCRQVSRWLPRFPGETLTTRKKS